MSKNKKEKTITTEKKPKKKASKLKSLISINKQKIPENIDFRTLEFKNLVKQTDIVDSEKLKMYIDGDNLPRWSLNYVRHVYQTEILKSSVILVRMVLRNGKTTSFFVNTYKPIFKYQQGCYIIDSSRITEDVGTGHASLFYHQDLSIPFNLLTDISRIRERIFETDNLKEIVENINPLVLKATVNSTLIQQVMAGGLLDKQIKTIVTIIIINTVLMIVLLIGAMINGFM